jgi:hypothetical protein
LTEKLVPLALFSSSVDMGTKKLIAERMLLLDRKTCSKRYGEGYGKPSFPKMPERSPVMLDTFIGEDSWSFFSLLKLEDSFLSLPVGEWEMDKGYQKGKEIVCNLAVVNDAA